MQAKQFETMIADMAGISSSEADQRIRPLREAGITPVGGRGPHAPHINSRQAAFMLLSLVSRRAVDSAKVAVRAANLVNVVGPFGPERELAPTINFLLKNPADDWMRRLMIAEDGSAAWMVSALQGPEQELLWLDKSTAEEAATDASAAKFGSYYLGRRFVLGGAVISELGTRLLAETPSECLEPDSQKTL